VNFTYSIPDQCLMANHILMAWQPANDSHAGQWPQKPKHKEAAGL